MLAIMNKTQTTVVEFIAKSEDTDEWKMVLVEEGPWIDSIDMQLRRLQERLYNCVDAALDGQLAEKFPDSVGKKIVIQLDCYNLPRAEVADFFDQFSRGALSTVDYQNALKQSRFIKGIAFEINFESIN